MDTKAPRLMDQVRESLRYRHYSLATEKLYVYWIRFFIRWSGLRHPKLHKAKLIFLAQVEQFNSKMHQPK